MSDSLFLAGNDDHLARLLLNTHTHLMLRRAALSGLSDLIAPNPAFEQPVTLFTPLEERSIDPRRSTKGLRRIVTAPVFTMGRTSSTGPCDAFAGLTVAEVLMVYRSAIRRQNKTLPGAGQAAQ